MIDRSSLPRIRIKSRQAGLPPKCPGRVRAHLHVTLGPMEWNALNSAKLRDESLYVALSWWGDDEQPATRLPLSNSRQTTTYFKVTRSMKTLQCYLTDMGALTLTLCDSDDNVIGAGSVPGIKRLAKDNPIREMSNIRDGHDGYRLGRLPILINMAEAKSSRSRSTSRSRSNSARRSNSRGRKKASPSPKRNNPSPAKSATEPTNQLIEPQQQQQRLERGDLGDINDKISSLLHKSNELFNQMNAMNSATSTMTQSQPIVPRLNITTSYSDINKENRTPNVPLQQSTSTTTTTQPSYPTFQQQYRPQPTTQLQATTFQHHQHQFPSTLGQARNLPQLTLNIPDMPVFNSRLPDTTQQHYHSETAKSDYHLPLVADNDISMNHSMHSVDYVPSETGSLLDQDILESIYTMNQHEPTQPRKISEEPVREKPHHWLRRGDELTIHCLSVELPQRKGRPPPSTTMRRIDDAFCLDFNIKWSSDSGTSSSRFQSSRMKNGLIWFDDEKCFTAETNVIEPLCMSLYHKTKFSNGWQVIDAAPVSTFDQLVTVKLGQYRVKLKMTRQMNQVENAVEKHNVHNVINTAVPEVSAGIEPVRHVNTPEDNVEFKMPHVLDIASDKSFEMSFPVSFVLCVKGASGLPSIKVNGQLEQPLTFLNIRSCLLEEGQLMMRTSERSMSPVFNCAHEWNCSVDASRIELLQASFFAFEMWCATLEQGDQLLGMGRISTAGLGSILAGGYSLLCSPRYPIVMADGKVPIRELASNQIRGHLEVVLAVGTSVQIDNFKNKRADVQGLVNSQSALEHSIIEASLDEEHDEEDEDEVSEVEINEEKQVPIGVSCLISIDRCSNITIRPHSKLRVTLDTLNGPISTEWSGSGNFSFQQCCTFSDPLPDKLVFSLQTKYMAESDFANRSVESLRREECIRELGWVEMGLHTLSIGFPQITGWYAIRSLSGESCGQIKLGLSPSIQTPRTGAIYTHRTVEPRPLTPPPPQRLEQSNAQLKGQLADLDELIKTVKAKQTSLNEQRKDMADLATQVTPSLSRVEMTPPKARTPPTPPADHKDDDEVIVPNVSARSDNHIRSVPPIDLEQFDTGDHSSISLAEHEPAASSSDDDESSDELNDIVPINSNQHIHMLSESNNDDPLSSTRVDDDDVEEEEEDSSEQKINKMMDAFQHSCQSARDNLELFKQLRDEKDDEEEEEIDEEQNATSVWNSTLESETERRIDDAVERVLDQPSSEHDDETLVEEEEEVTEQEVINTVEAVTVTHSIEVDSSELDELVSQSAITVDEDIIVDHRPGLARLTMEAMDRTDSSNDDSSLRIERPDRTAQMTLNPKQTRRLAAIFGLK